MHCCINFQLKASPNSFGVEHFTPVVEILICNAVARYNYLVIITVVEARIWLALESSFGCIAKLVLWHYVLSSSLGCIVTFQWLCCDISLATYCKVPLDVLPF